MSVLLWPLVSFSNFRRDVVVGDIVLGNSLDVLIRILTFLKGTYSMAGDKWEDTKVAA